MGLLATPPPTRIVVEQGGTPWWVPLLIALAAALASYFATWWLKRADVNRESAFRAADLVDQAEQLSARLDRYNAAPDGGAKTVQGLLQSARIRAQPLNDADLEDRFIAAISFAFDIVLLQREPGGARHWINEAVANVRSALVPHLAAPRLFGRRTATERSLPTRAELNAMPNDDDDGTHLIGALLQWRVERAQNEPGWRRVLRRR